MATESHDLRTILKDMADTSTIHGLSRISTSRKPLVKVLWVIVFIGTTAYLAFQLTQLASNYYSWPIKTTVALDFNRLQFPAISFCNWNAIRKTHINMTSPEVQKYLKTKPKLQDTLPRENINITEPNLVLDIDYSGDEYFIDGNGDEDSFGFDAWLEDMYDEYVYTEYNFEDYHTMEHVEMDIHEDFIHHIHKEILRKEMLGKPRDKWMERIEKFIAAFQKMSKTTRREVGHRLRNMLFGCTFNHQKCHNGDFKLFQSARYGNCYTLNTTNWYSRRSGPSRGLWLTLNLEIPEYITSAMTGSGVKLMIHRTGTMAFPKTEGITLSPGFETFIGLRMINVSRLGYPYGECESGEEFQKAYGKMYSAEFCRQICMLRWTAKICGCVPHDFDVELDDSVYRKIKEIRGLPNCVYESIKYKQCESIVDHAIMNDQADCKCHTPCSDIVFQKTISGRPWPNDKFLHQVLMKHMCERNLSYTEDICRDYNAGPNTANLASWKDNFLRVIIYYEDLNYEQIIETPMYDWFRFTSDIGGTLGLFIGASILSSVEILQFILELLYWMWLHLYKRRLKQ